MNDREAKEFLDRKVQECLKDFPRDFSTLEEVEIELGKRVVTCLEQTQSPEELWAILQADYDNFETALSLSTPMYGAYGGRTVSSERAEVGVKYCIIHNILFFRSLNLLTRRDSAGPKRPEGQEYGAGTFTCYTFGPTPDKQEK